MTKDTCRLLGLLSRKGIRARAGIIIDRGVEVSTCAGTVLRINIFRSTDGANRPVIMSIHPYGKNNLPSRRGERWTYSVQYHVLRQPDPVTFSALTGWEAPDPAWWMAQASL